MELASFIHQYLPALKAKYADALLPGHHRALARCCAVERPMPVKCCCTAPIVPRRFGAHIRAATVVCPTTG
jgi:hypothetical protein